MGVLKRSLQTSTAVVFALLVTAQSGDAQDDNADRWEKNIRQFEARIESGESRPNGVLFLGSSSIRMWDLKKWFPDRNAVNHGFGGSEISDSIRYFDRIVVPLRPHTIVLYAGDNDIAKGKSADIVHRDFTTFAGMVRAKLPETRLLFVAIKPSIKRWNLAEEISDANSRIAADCKADDRLGYIDIWMTMLGDDGRPRPELFAKDGLHLNETGYKLWTGIVRDMLKKSPASE